MMCDPLYVVADAASGMSYFQGPAPPTVGGQFYFPGPDPLHEKIVNQINYYFRFVMDTQI